MNDRELLEKAAKAAGIVLWHEDVFTNGLTQKVSDNGILRWNPLTDDGDALRLAVNLGFIVDTHGMHTRISFPFAFDALVHEPHGVDPLAATRRAIVIAAAEVGKELP